MSNGRHTSHKQESPTSQHVALLTGRPVVWPDGIELVVPDLAVAVEFARQAFGMSVVDNDHVIIPAEVLGMRGRRAELRTIAMSTRDDPTESAYPVMSLVLCAYITPQMEEIRRTPYDLGQTCLNLRADDFRWEYDRLQRLGVQWFEPDVVLKEELPHRGPVRVRGYVHPLRALIQLSGPRQPAS